MPTLSLISSKPGFSYVNPGVAYIDLGQGGGANSPKNVTFYFNKVAGTAATLGITLSVRNSSFPVSQYTTVTIATLTLPAKYSISDLAYGETEFKLTATLLDQATISVDVTTHSS